jgi:hypothetical protein
MTHTSRSANQSKTEPIPASATDNETPTPGTSHPQSPGACLRPGSGSQGDSGQVPASGTEPAPGTSEELPVVQGLHVPDVEETDARS